MRSKKNAALGLLTTNLMRNILFVDPFKRQWEIFNDSATYTEVRDRLDYLSVTIDPYMQNDFLDHSQYDDVFLHKKINYGDFTIYFISDYNVRPSFYSDLLLFDHKERLEMRNLLMLSSKSYNDSYFEKELKSMFIGIDPLFLNEEWEKYLNVIRP